MSVQVGATKMAGLLVFPVITTAACLLMLGAAKAVERTKRGINKCPVSRKREGDSPSRRARTMGMKTLLSRRHGGQEV